MPYRLTIIIIALALLFLYYVYKNVREHKLSIKNTIIWTFMSLGVILVTLLIEPLKDFSKLIGIQEASNLVFFLGFIFFIFLCFNFTKILSIQHRKIDKLTQELAILKEELEHKEKKKNKKK